MQPLCCLYLPPNTDLFSYHTRCPIWIFFLSANGKQGRHVGQGLLSNCSLICAYNHNQNRHTNHNCPDYNLATNLCVTGIHVSECQDLMSTRGAPFTIQSRLSSDFFLVGLIERHSCSGQYPHLVLTPISHSVASAIKKIIEKWNTHTHLHTFVWGVLLVTCWKATVVDFSKINMLAAVGNNQFNQPETRVFAISTVGSEATDSSK